MYEMVGRQCFKVTILCSNYSDTITQTIFQCPGEAAFKAITWGPQNLHLLVSLKGLTGVFLHDTELPS